MTQNKEWIPYDPTWLIELAKEQHPKERWLPNALAQCTKVFNPYPGYFYFVEKIEYQFERNIHLDSDLRGSIVLDVLKQIKIGGLEILFELMPPIVCHCGYTFDYQAVSSHQSVLFTWDNFGEYRRIQTQLNSWKAKIQRKRYRKARIQQLDKMERLYQCPQCDGIVWYKKGKKEPHYFACLSDKK